ncbi:MAG: hypothetical protein P0111_02660 [Nitrospira sp.]|nr:hypothetical protein [Nitrospira sp.]
MCHQMIMKSEREDGHVLLVTLMLMLILSMLGMSSLYLAGQDRPGISAMKEETIAEQLADSATDLAMNWFHDPSTTPATVRELLARRQGDPTTGPSFFDAALRSQFVGTAEHPDILFDAANAADNTILNGPPSGFVEALRGIGRLTRFKLYGPLRPGLLATMEITASTIGARPLTRTVQIQLGALSIPPIRAAIQVGGGLGTAQADGESPVRVHWGDQRVEGNLVVRRLEDIAVKTGDAPVTGQPYDLLKQAVDRWVEYWIGGELTVIVPPPGQSVNPVPPQSVHLQQSPLPGVRLDQWDYESMKQTALRYGVYYRLDGEGLLHHQDASEGERGFSSSELLASQTVGDNRGLVFIDTIDGEPPSPNNMGTLVLDADYLESVLIVHGHVVLRSQGPGRSFPVLTPAQNGTRALGTRIPVQLSGIHLRGLLWVGGSITVEQPVKLFGAAKAGGTVVSTNRGASLEIWYDADLAQGLFRGLPVVYKAPRSWRVL